MTPEQDKFCDNNCVWTDHHPNCVLTEPDWYHIIDVHGCNRFYHKTEDCPYELKTPLYTTPPQRTWVHLTNQEHEEIAIECGCLSADWVFYGAILERKIKEKNTI